MANGSRIFSRLHKKSDTKSLKAAQRYASAPSIIFVIVLSIQIRHSKNSAETLYALNLYDALLTLDQQRSRYVTNWVSW